MQGVLSQKIRVLATYLFDRASHYQNEHKLMHQRPLIQFVARCTSTRFLAKMTLVDNLLWILQLNCLHDQPLLGKGQGFDFSRLPAY